jgi:hypothetical protein
MIVNVNDCLNQLLRNLICQTEAEALKKLEEEQVRQRKKAEKLVEKERRRAEYIAKQVVKEVESPNSATDADIMSEPHSKYTFSKKVVFIKLTIQRSHIEAKFHSYF